MGGYLKPGIIEPKFPGTTAGDGKTEGKYSIQFSPSPLKFQKIEISWYLGRLHDS